MHFVAKRSVAVPHHAIACCQNLHAIVEHFEERYAVLQPCSQLLTSQPYPPNFYHSAPSANPKLDPHHQHPQQQYQPAQPSFFDPDDMEIDMGSSPASASRPSSPLTPVTTHFVPFTTQQPFVNASSFTHLSLSQPPLGCHLPASAFDTSTSTSTTTIPQSRASTSRSASSQTQHDPFSTSSVCSDYGVVRSSYLQASHETTSASSRQPAGRDSCIPPTLPYSSNFITPANTFSNTHVATPLAAHDQIQASYHPFSAQASRPYPSLRLSKPIRCPKPNCNKTYRQVDALKSHLTRGCNSAPQPEVLEAPRALSAEKGVVVNGNDHLGERIMEGELHELERGKEHRLRPLGCGIGNCRRRYRSMEDFRTSLPRPRSHCHLG